jgi:hypothetical protein
MMIIYIIFLLGILYFLFKIIKYFVDKNRVIISKKCNNPKNIIITEFGIYDCCHDYFDTLFKNDQLIISYHKSF